MLKVNILLVLFSLPIITIGPALIAAFSVCLKMTDDSEGYVGRQFVKAFRSNLKQGIPLGILFLFCCYVVYLDFEINRAMPEGSIMLIIFGILACFIFGMSFIYAFALSARYENTLVNTLKNSANIASRYFVQTIFLVVIIAVEIFLFMFNSTTLFFGILIGPTCIIFTISGFAMKFFRIIEAENKAE
ncbi:MAG: YesL family protein [Lachnospiraceae bacterium]|nr:YesL family protein [Lachnospiraceae bacterium]